jgi:hypothetical protein
LINPNSVDALAIRALPNYMQLLGGSAMNSTRRTDRTVKIGKLSDEERAWLMAIIIARCK